MADGIKPVDRGNPFRLVLHKQRVRWAIVSTAVVVMITVVALGAGKMAVDIIHQGRMYGNTVMAMILGLLGVFTCIAFFSGQISSRILKGGWDSWIAELGPNEILMLISSLKRAYKTMTGQEIPPSAIR